MAGYFVDSSALVKRYVQEDGTSWVRRLTRRSARNPIYLARITAVEVTAAGKGEPSHARRYLRSSTAFVSSSP
jgi:predicted nucleic acid-binding protein